MERDPIIKTHEVATRLDSLDLNPQILRDAVQWAYGFNVAEVTENEPPNSKGMIMYLKLTRALRDRLIPLGWKRDNSRNYATTIDPEGTVAIVVAGGDEDTGREDGNPWTISRKGQAAKDAVDKGQMTFDLGDIIQLVSTRGPQVWVLLVYVDDGAGEIRMEMARPRGIQVKSFIRNWQERIILSPIPIQLPISIDQESSQDIDVEVKRRSSEE